MVKGNGGKSTCDERGGTTGLCVAMGGERRTGEPSDGCSKEETIGGDSTGASTGQVDDDNNGLRVASTGEQSMGSCESVTEGPSEETGGEVTNRA